MDRNKNLSTFVIIYLMCPFFEITLRGQRCLWQICLQTHIKNRLFVYYSKYTQTHTPHTIYALFAVQTLVPWLYLVGVLWSFQSDFESYLPICLFTAISNVCSSSSFIGCYLLHASLFSLILMVSWPVRRLSDIISYVHCECIDKICECSLFVGFFFFFFIFLLVRLNRFSHLNIAYCLIR